VVQFWQERRDGLPNQIPAPRSHEIGSCAVREFDKAVLIDRDNGCWTRFYQYAYSLLGYQSQPTVAQDFGDEQSGSDQSQGFKTRTDGSVGWVQVAETLAKQRTCCAHYDNCPAWQEPGCQHDRKQIEKTQRNIWFGPPIQSGDR
jgi:hypothetical protein